MTSPQILIVEDSPTIRYTTRTMLATGGYEVLTAADGKEAVRLAAEMQPGLILLDVILPKLNGFQVCREIKTTPQTAHIPVVMITSKSKESDRHWGMEQGADDYLVKPFDAVELLNVVGRYFAIEDRGHDA